MRTMLPFAMFRFGHLKAAEFTELLEGQKLSSSSQIHVDKCSRCRAELEAITPLFEDLAEGGRAQSESHSGIDFSEVREGVRDQLLGRSVKRSSFIQRWTGQDLSSSTALGFSFAVVLCVVSLGIVWHYRTAHPGAEAPALPVEFASETIFLGEDPDVLEVEAMAWSQTDIFAALAELDTNEEDALRQMIAAALTDEDVGLPQVR